MGVDGGGVTVAAGGWVAVGNPGAAGVEAQAVKNKAKTRQKLKRFTNDLPK
jgi:hypothetical protein